MMATDIKSVPHYVVLVEENLRYKLDENKRILGNASDDLVEFAQKKALRLKSDLPVWDQFAIDCGLSRDGRKQLVCYLLRDEDRQELAEM
jgi:hypothetical protein